VSLPVSQLRQGAARLGPAHPTRMRTSGGQVRRLMLRSNNPESEGPLLFNALVRHGVNDIFAVQHTLGTEGVRHLLAIDLDRANQVSPGP
jgi:hypothetical protein